MALTRDNLQALADLLMGAIEENTSKMLAILPRVSDPHLSRFETYQLVHDMAYKAKRCEKLIAAGKVVAEMMTAYDKKLASSQPG